MLSRRFPVGPLALLVLIFSSCMPSDEELGEMSYQLEVYAAAARDYEERTGAWPRDLDDLDLVLERTPSYETNRVRLRTLEAQGDERLRLDYESHPASEEASEASPTFEGKVLVTATSIEDQPAAEIHWGRSGSLISSSGRITMQSCALGDYGAIESADDV